MDEPTAMLPPVSTVTLTEVLERGPPPLAEALELLAVIAAQIALLHAEGRTHGLLTAQVIRVQTFESGPPIVVFGDMEATRDMSEGADQWSLGVLTFQLLAGRYPKPNEALRDALPDVSPSLDRLVGKLMAPKPKERLAAAAAQRQFHDLATAALDPKATAVAPLAPPPQLKKPAPLAIGDEATDLRAQLPKELRPKSGPSRPSSSSASANPFADDEATAMVEARPTAPDPPTARYAGPLEDEKTLYEPPSRLRPTERMEALPPPVPTPHEAPVVHEKTSSFEPSRSDLPARLEPPTAEAPRPPPPPVRRKRRNAAEQTPLAELLRVARESPPWVWGALGVGLAFFVLLLIALAR